MESKHLELELELEHWRKRKEKKGPCVGRLPERAKRALGSFVVLHGSRRKTSWTRGRTGMSIANRRFLIELTEEFH